MFSFKVKVVNEIYLMNNEQHPAVCNYQRTITAVGKDVSNNKPLLILCEFSAGSACGTQISSGVNIAIDTSW
jgi:ethanolamine utilization protein EutA (predicted chaperonin)